MLWHLKIKILSALITLILKCCGWILTSIDDVVADGDGEQADEEISEDTESPRGQPQPMISPLSMEPTAPPLCSCGRGRYLYSSYYCPVCGIGHSRYGYVSGA
ncbi:hypothetical protein Patl1_26063 [Pistacia atlantica]|uniref:Uncharacterized protein n=2 Tax=Pistacia atlantica TaxID=434234 RepID=A0ACC1B2P2_9ROSI|nr:hypothetical protein Patl1_26065 [Pistacia atlantica]KAJ0093492.1 hypothetical protein Patl1_26063 [Pistacia atlantica]